MKTINKTNIKTDNKINWNVFDHIWCNNFSMYKSRRKGLEKEFDRIGISKYKNFTWNYTTTSVFNNILFDFTKKGLKKNSCKSVKSMNNTLSHFKSIKTSIEFGCDHILVMEDDIRFLKNKNTIAKIIDNLPEDYDLINFDVFCGGFREGEYNKMISGEKTNDLFVQYTKGYGASCYALSRRAMKEIVMGVENFIIPFDNYFTELLVARKYKCYMPIIPLCCQLNYKGCENSLQFGESVIHDGYHMKNLDYSLYNIFDKKDYNYGDFVE